MAYANWENYYDEKYGYGFYDFSDEEIEAMERDRKRDQAAEAAAQQQQQPAAQPSTSDRATGEFNDILGSLQVDAQAGQAMADQYASMQPSANNETSQLLAGFSEQVNAINAANQSNINALTAIFTQQSAQFQEAQQLAAQQLQESEERYQEQMRINGNLQSAFVPAANPSAFSTQMGDQRPDDTRPKQNNNLSDLSSLSIVSGLGTTANPLSGLQLA